MWIKLKNIKKYLIDTKLEDYIKLYSVTQIFTQTTTYQFNRIAKLDDGNLYHLLLFCGFFF